MSRFPMQCRRVLLVGNARKYSLLAGYSLYLPSVRSDGPHVYFEPCLQRQYCDEYWDKHYCYSVEQLNYSIKCRPSRVLIWITNQVAYDCDCMSLSLFLSLHLYVFLGVVPCTSAVCKMVCKEQTTYHGTHEHTCHSSWT